MSAIKVDDYLGLPPVVPWSYGLVLIPFLAYLVYKVSEMHVYFLQDILC